MADAPLSIPDALARLRRADAPAADDVVDALQWMLGDRPLSRLNQAGVQQFLWFELPFKWLGGVERHRRVVRALRRFFELSGYDRYAALCDDPFTATQLQRFAEGGFGAGYRRFLARHERSGVVPIDTPSFRWGRLLGEVAWEAYWDVAMGLELAVAAGALDGAARGGTAAVQAEVDRLLDVRRPERFGQSWREEIALERIGAYLEGSPSLSTARAQILGAVGHRLVVAPDGPRRWRDALLPLRWLAGVVAAEPAGLRLTATGALPGPAVAEAAARFGPRLGWTGAGVPRRAAQAPGLGVLVDVAGRGGLVRVARGHLVEGRLTALDQVLARGLLPDRGLDAAVWPLALALVLAAPTGVEAVARAVAVAITEEGVTGPGGRPHDLAVVAGAVDRLAAALTLFAGLRRRPVGGTAPLVLTAVGEAIAVAALREAASGPPA